MVESKQDYDWFGEDHQAPSNEFITEQIAERIPVGRPVILMCRLEHLDSEVVDKVRKVGLRVRESLGLVFISQ